MSFDRRGFVHAAIGTSVALAASGCIPSDRTPLGRSQSSLRIIEAASGGTLGVEIFDTGSGLSLGHNRDMRFGHCSSFKLSLAAMTLARDAAGEDDADRLVRWSEEDLISYSPFATRRLSEGATLRELAEFTQKWSDNTAANILLREFGGPEALTAFWRSIGDDVSRLDRIEPELNNVPPGEVRDTTTPVAMAQTVAKLAFGDVLPDEHKATLRQWMIDTRSGRRRVRAGLPETWVAGDKTGTSIWPGMGRLYVDVGFVDAPGGSPIAFATYFRAAGMGGDRVVPEEEAVLEQVGRELARFARQRGATAKLDHETL
ncbi:MAG: class A beta-lactamase [Pseudomonadota bacterium]